VGVQFRIDENGILEVLARDTAENRDVVLEISDAAVDVEDEAVEAMIGESVEHAFEDMNERIFTEARLMAEELLPAVEEGLKVLGEVLGETEVSRIEATAADVRSALASDPPDAPRLKDCNAALDAATQILASLLVERALDQATDSI
jgi:molecular chaperone DnaK